MKEQQLPDAERAELLREKNEELDKLRDDLERAEELLRQEMEQTTRVFSVSQRSKT